MSQLSILRADALSIGDVVYFWRGQEELVGTVIDVTGCEPLGKARITFEILGVDDTYTVSVENNYDFVSF